MYRAVIFDMDGTLADSFSTFYETLRKLGPEIGIHGITPEDILIYRQKGAMELIKEFKIKLWKIPYLIKKGQKMFGNRMHEITIFPGIQETLEELQSRGVVLGILSTNSKRNIKRLLHDHKLNMFSFYVSTNSALGKGRALKKLLKKNGWHPNEVIYIGDELRDIRGAKHAHIDSGAVAWGYNDVSLLKKEEPTWVFEKPKDILKILPKNSAS